MSQAESAVNLRRQKGAKTTPYNQRLAVTAILFAKIFWDIIDPRRLPHRAWRGEGHQWASTADNAPIPLAL
jgi:hypothetical protein